MLLSLSGTNEEGTNDSSVYKIRSQIINNIIRTSNHYYVAAMCGGIIIITALLGLLIRFKSQDAPDDNNGTMSLTNTREQQSMRLLNMRLSNSPRYLEKLGKANEFEASKVSSHNNEAKSYVL